MKQAIIDAIRFELFRQRDHGRLRAVADATPDAFQVSGVLDIDALAKAIREVIYDA